MATIGQSLTAPEAGWKRVDDKDLNISYTSGWVSVANSNCYNGSLYQVNKGNKNVEYARFSFSGTKIRLISIISTQYPQYGYISIDGVEYQYNIKGSPIYQALVFEKTGLTSGEHTVSVYQKDLWNDVGLVLDAIDIDADGVLKPYNPTLISAPANLTVTSGDAQVTLTWDAVTGATGYNVKRSTTAGGPYTTTVATNVSGTSYVDTSVVNGTTYYYVVTALGGTSESANSNEASATPVAPVNVLLRITMNDSSEREYKVTQTVANDFISWCNRTIGTGNSCYVFDKSAQSSKEYLFYEKIISFEVIPLPAE